MKESDRWSIMDADYWTHKYLEGTPEERREFSRCMVKADEICYLIGGIAFVAFIIVALVKGWI